LRRALIRIAAGTKARLEATEEDKLIRQTRLSNAVREILDCLGEDPDREGLKGTPERYAQAMLYFTKGYEENMKGIIPSITVLIQILLMALCLMRIMMKWLL
jgi:GTP cyclohydrolase I